MLSSATSAAVTAKSGRSREIWWFCVLTCACFADPEAAVPVVANLPRLAQVHAQIHAHPGLCLPFLSATAHVQQPESHEEPAARAAAGFSHRGRGCYCGGSRLHIQGLWNVEFLVSRFSFGAGCVSFEVQARSIGKIVDFARRKRKLHLST